MREHARKIVSEAQRSEDSPLASANRIGVDLHVEARMQTASKGELLAVEAIRLARLATSIHLSRAAEMLAEQSMPAARTARTNSDQRRVMREIH